MHIDWFVFSAQIINFLILIFLLKYFLYGRIIKAMDEREAEIVSRYEEAERLNKEAREAADASEEKNRSLTDMAQELLNKARQEAEESRTELTRKAREEVDQVQKRWYEALEKEKKSFVEDLSRRSGTYIFDTVRKILMDLADAELEKKIFDVFIRHIEAEGETLSVLGKSAISADAGMTVRSSFELSDDQRRIIHEALKPYIPEDLAVTYELTPGVISGIEMIIQGYKISWSINDYISSLEKDFFRILRENVPAVPAP